MSWCLINPHRQKHRGSQPTSCCSRCVVSHHVWRRHHQQEVEVQKQLMKQVHIQPPHTKQASGLISLLVQHRRRVTAALHLTEWTCHLLHHKVQTWRRRHSLSLSLKAFTPPAVSRVKESQKVINVSSVSGYHHLLCFYHHNLNMFYSLTSPQTRHSTQTTTNETRPSGRRKRKRRRKVGTQLVLVFRRSCWR